MRAVEHELDNRWACLDVVMANAGIAGPTSYVEDVTLEDWKHCIAVNLDGAFLACRYAARRMKQQGSGVDLHSPLQQPGCLAIRVVRLMLRQNGALSG